MENTKVFLTYDQQIQLLQEKGLLIKDKIDAKKKLEDIGYYKLINAYKHHFMFSVKDSDGNVIDKKYYENVSIDDIYQLYVFDTALKSIVFKATTIAETKLKSKLSYFISEHYGVEESLYLDEKNYSTYNSKVPDGHLKVIELIKEEISKQEPVHPALIWYKKNYGFYPLWVIINILSFGMVSRFYSILNYKDKVSIALSYGLQPKSLESFVVFLSRVRNVCAHNDVLYNYKARNTISQNDIKNVYKKLKLSIKRGTTQYEHGADDFLAILIAIKFFIDEKSYKDLIEETYDLLNKLSENVEKNILDNIKLQMGLVNEWRNKLI